jgi:hypothetical protein
VLRRKANKPKLPTWFVAFGAGRAWAQTVANAAKHYRNKGRDLFERRRVRQRDQYPSACLSDPFRHRLGYPTRADPRRATV